MATLNINPTERCNIAEQQLERQSLIQLARG